MKRILALILILLIVLPMAAQCGGVLGGGSPSSGGGGSNGGGGGSRASDIDNMIRQMENWKKNDPDKFQKLQTVLWKNPITTDKYVWPTVLMYYKGNNTIVTRNQPLDITTIVINNNPMEVRRMLDLYLEVKNPGSDKYERINTWPEKIQTNEYKEKTNTSYRNWDMLPSLNYLKTVGLVKVRVSVSDGVNRWSTADYRDVRPPYYSELIFNVTNSQPAMSNFTVTPLGQARYNDPIEYKANIADPDNDVLNVTLHILDSQGTEQKNVTRQVKGSGVVSFKNNEYGLFGEADAGKNFTYYYSFDDGLSANHTEVQEGPSIKRGPKLFVDKLGFTTESESYYWWQWYIFHVQVKNLNPEKFDVILTLYTKTGNNDWITVDSKTVKVGPEPQMVYFNRSIPFVVTDANKTFFYRINLSEYDQSGKDTMESVGSRIDPKIVQYTMKSPVMLLNLGLMILIIVCMGLLMERWLKRGIESQESSSGKPMNANKINGAKSGNSASNSIVSKISAMFRRRG